MRCDGDCEGTIAGSHGCHGRKGNTFARYASSRPASSTRMYPRLRPGGCEVTYRTEPVRLRQPPCRGLRMKPPQLSSSNAATCSTNLKFVGRTAKQREACTVQGPKPASVVFRISSPTDLAALSAAARVSIRLPSPPGAEFKLSWSPESPIEWKEFGRFTSRRQRILQRLGRWPGLRTAGQPPLRSRSRGTERRRLWDEPDHDGRDVREMLAEGRRR